MPELVLHRVHFRYILGFSVCSRNSTSLQDKGLHIYLNVLSIIQKRLSTDSGSGFPEDTPLATKRARNMSGEESDESATGGKGRRGSFGRRRRKSGRRMSFVGLRRTAAE